MWLGAAVAYGTSETSPEIIAMTAEAKNVGFPHWPGYGKLNHGASSIPEALPESVLDESSSGKTSAAVKIKQKTIPKIIPIKIGYRRHKSTSFLLKFFVNQGP